MNQYPIFIICRDRVSCLSQLVEWLENAGQERIYLMDNDSTYEPLLEYYKKSPHTVVYIGSNLGHNGIWMPGIMDEYTSDEFYVASDPDILPVETCPPDAMDYFYHILQKYPDRMKCGFGLKIDDIPDHYNRKNEVIQHEEIYWRWQGPEPGCHFAPIDTTFALYRPGSTAQESFSFSVRTGDPYIARHMPWYLDTNNLNEEELYYRVHAEEAVTHWNK